MFRVQSFTSLLYIFLISCSLAACDKDPEPRTRLLFTAGTNLTTNNRSVTAGEIITTSVFAEAPAGKSLTKFTIQYAYKGSGANTAYGDAVTYLDSTFTSNQFAMVFAFGSRGVSGEETWLFSVTDSDNNTVTRQYTLKTTGTDQPIRSYATIFYNKSPLENLKFFSVDEGTVYPAYLVQNNSAIKDKSTFYFETSALNDTLVTIKGINGTKLKLTSVANTDNIKTTNDLQNLYATSGTEMEAVSNIAEPKIIAFKTANKTGLIRISNFEKLFDATRNKRILMRARYEVRVEK